jgi:hypothetical protein
VPQAPKQKLGAVLPPDKGFTYLVVVIQEWVCGDRPLYLSMY